MFATIRSGYYSSKNTAAYTAHVAVAVAVAIVVVVVVMDTDGTVENAVDCNVAFIEENTAASDC